MRPAAASSKSGVRKRITGILLEILARSSVPARKHKAITLVANTTNRGFLAAIDQGLKRGTRIIPRAVEQRRGGDQRLARLTPRIGDGWIDYREDRGQRDLGALPSPPFAVELRVAGALPSPPPGPGLMKCWCWSTSESPRFCCANCPALPPARETPALRRLLSWHRRGPHDALCGLSQASSSGRGRVSNALFKNKPDSLQNKMRKAVPHAAGRHPES